MTTETMAGSAFRSAPFRRLWTAGLLSDTGDWLLFIALPLVVLRLTGSAVATSFAFVLELVPAIVLAPLVARLVNRLDRRTFMWMINVGQALSLIPLLFIHALEDLPLVYVVIVLQAVFSAAFEPTKNALLPALVGADRIVSANALVSLNQNLGRLLGGPLGGVLLAVGNLSLVVAADLASYLASAVLVTCLPQSRPPASTVRAPRSSLVRVLIDRNLRGPFTVIFATSIAQGMFVVLFVFFVTDTLGGTEADVGLLRGVQAIGAIAAGIALGFIASRIGVRALSITGATAFAVVSLIIWNLSFVTDELWAYIVLFAVVGAPGVFLGDGLVSILQLTSNDDQRGSVFATLGLVMALGQSVGLLIAGALQETVGTLPLLELQGVIYLLAAGLACLLLKSPPAKAG
ncbi:MFS transporter [Paenarthrobacter sp. PH39-S1]|uniref:MFS transporter n=1 Tax=Paenarthrobacter sp. PH39-S1 TaxID=3046204 RepID=UPI0024BA5205|nr:MFS transporter [Paenarthrobacter sp. PH39-S1]MDJ0356640.1 MFS transporter [Paenarthrobacter sp. PH39-S1]